MQYWPASKDKHEDYGGIGVSVLAEEELANFHIRTIKIYKKDEKDVRKSSILWYFSRQTDVTDEGFSTNREREKGALKAVLVK